MVNWRCYRLGTTMDHPVTAETNFTIPIVPTELARKPSANPSRLELDTHELDGVPVCIYSPEKTLADCFKYRNKLGLDIAIEALRLYISRRNVKVDEIMRFARICRVANVIRPYLEAVF